MVCVKVNDKILDLCDTGIKSCDNQLFLLEEVNKVSQSLKEMEKYYKQVVDSSIYGETGNNPDGGFFKSKKIEAERALDKITSVDFNNRVDPSGIKELEDIYDSAKVGIYTNLALTVVCAICLIIIK